MKKLFSFTPDMFVTYLQREIVPILLDSDCVDTNAWTSNKDTIIMHIEALFIAVSHLEPTFRTVATMLRLLRQSINTKVNLHIQINELWYEMRRRKNVTDTTITYEIAYWITLILETYFVQKVMPDSLESEVSSFTREIRLMAESLQQIKDISSMEVQSNMDVLGDANSENIHLAVQLYRELQEAVVGQSETLKRMSIMLYHFLEDSNEVKGQAILIVGPTGSGKSLLFTQLLSSKLLRDKRISVLCQDCSKLTAEGFSGLSVSDIEKELEKKLILERNVNGKTLLLLDEADKIISYANCDSGSNNTHTVVQNQLLKLCEKNNIFVVMAGAFTNIAEEQVWKHNNPIGFTMCETNTNREDSSNMQDCLSDYKKVLIECGAQRELVGRIECIMKMDPMTKTQLEIIADREINRKIEQFRLSGIKLSVENRQDTISTLAELSLIENLGARSVKNMLSMLDNYEFLCLEEGKQQLIIDAEVLLGKKKALMSRKGGINEQEFV